MAIHVLCYMFCMLYNCIILSNRCTLFIVYKYMVRIYLFYVWTANNPPRITGPTTLFIRLGVEAELTFNVMDDNNNYNVTVLGGLPDNSTLSLKSNDADGVMEYVFKWQLLELVNVSLLFEAKDDFNAASVLNVQLQICACENGGNCTTDGLFSISGSSILLNCQCPEGIVLPN